MSRVCVRSGRFHICTVLVVTGFLLLCGRLFFLQVVQAEALSAEGQSVRKRLIKTEAKRGDILDRNGNLLAGTRSRILLGVDPHVADPDDIAGLAMLAGILDMPYAEVQESFSRRERIDSAGLDRRVRWAPLKEIGEDLFASVEALGIKGVYGNRRYERYYPGREMASHVIGYLNREQAPVMGIERAFDYYLRGQCGWRETEVDGQRRELAVYREREVAPRNGLHVELTIDLFVQSVIEKALLDLSDEARPESASIIVSDPRSGEILGLANYPAFDPNRFTEFPIEDQRNRALSNQYEPGSTFKIVTVAAALEEGLVGPDTLIDCSTERVQFNGVNIPMPSDHRNLGTVPVRTVVSKSSNRGSARIGMLLGERRMYEYARRFGFGERSGWPLEGEAEGALMPVERWDGYTISRLPTGYAVGATPMQIHLAMATLANDGVRVQPRLLRQVIDPAGGVPIALQAGQRQRVVSAQTARQMKEMLTRVVSAEGTARRADLPGYLVAGKTGTARKLVDGRYSTAHHIASFSGFFPAPNPELVITVVVDDARIDGPAYGGLVAAPVFRAIGEKLIPHLAIRKPENWEPFIVSND
jgi:cell division protein FtsI/penicillin-binding protein 2